MDVTVLAGEGAHSFINYNSTREAWDRLYNRCPWANPYQSWEFIATWYDVYRSVYEPVIAVNRDCADGLEALLPLARHCKSGRLTVAGHWDAEYQGWLTLAEHQDSFPPAALREINRRYPRRDIIFRYLVPGIPLDWLYGTDHGLRHKISQWRRPLLNIPSERALKSLRKRSKQSRINRLKRMGELQFNHLHAPEELRSIIDDVAAQSDFRHGAVHGIYPFERDPLRREFLLRLFETGLLHVTTFRTGNLLLAAELNIAMADQMTLHVMTQTSIHPRLSPGLLHMLQLTGMMAREGFKRLDLTPGGDKYKDNLADDYDYVAMLTIFGGRSNQLIHRWKESAENIARKGLRAIRVEPREARHCFLRLWAAGLLRTAGRLARDTARMSAHKAEYEIYAINPADAEITQSPAQVEVKKNSFADLLLQPPTDEWDCRRGFLNYAMTRFADDAHAYTICDSKRLRQIGWMQLRSERIPAFCACDSFFLPTDSASIFDLHTARGADACRLVRQMLATMIADAETAGAKLVFVCIDSRQKNVDRVVREAGFVHIASSYRRMTFGRLRSHRLQWQQNELAASVAAIAARKAQEAAEAQRAAEAARATAGLAADSVMVATGAAARDAEPDDDETCREAEPVAGSRGSSRRG